MQVEFLFRVLVRSVGHRCGVLDAVIPHVGLEVLPRNGLGALHLGHVDVPRVHSEDLATILAPREVLDVAKGPWHMPIRSIVLLQGLGRHREGHDLLELHWLRREEAIPPTRGCLGAAIGKVPELSKLHGEDDNVEAHKGLSMGEFVEDGERHVVLPTLGDERSWTDAHGRRRLLTRGRVVHHLRHGVEVQPVEDVNDPAVAHPRGFVWAIAL
mmetsp:Transcript_46414/g.99190  ORF Transcript_46414/g.99190 Transcript_46414/m.99190 type:complete len:213 (+) Transcript_46414:1087-1725(+)